MTTANAAGRSGGFMALAERLLRATTGAIALLGGMIIVGLALLSVVSILGRWLGGIPWLGDHFLWLGAIPGDYEITEMGTAIAVFAFLPYCQIRYSHVVVDVFVMNARERFKAALTLIGNALFTLVMAFMTWRLYFGMQEKQLYMETSMMLGLPIWWGFAPSLALLGLTTLVSAYTTVDALFGLIRGRDPNSLSELDEEAL